MFCQISKINPDIKDLKELDKDVLEQEKTNKMGVFNTKVASAWLEGRKVYQK